MSVKQAQAEIFSTLNGKVIQDNQKLCFIVEWQGKRSVFKLPCFFGLKRRVEAVDIEKMIQNPSSCHDFEIIAPCGSDRCFVLNIPELIEFRNLLSGAKVMMDLNSIIFERLHRPVRCV